MDRPRISIWRMIRGIVGTIAGTTAVLGGFLVLTRGSPWLLPVMLLGVPLPFVALSGGLAWRARSKMRTFADAVGGNPRVDYGSFGEVTLTWPERGIELTANAYRGTWWRLILEVDGEIHRVQPRRLEELVFETLGRLGETEPTGEPWDGEIDGPLHVGSIGGVAFAGLGVGGLALIVLPERVALGLGALSVVVASVLTVWGGWTVRQRLVDRLEAAEDRGLVVGQLRFVHAGIRPRWALWIGTEFVRIEGLVLGPWSRLEVEGLDTDAEGPARSDPSASVDGTTGSTLGGAKGG